MVHPEHARKYVASRVPDFAFHVLSNHRSATYFLAQHTRRYRVLQLGIRRRSRDGPGETELNEQAFRRAAEIAASKASASLAELPMTFTLPSDLDPGPGPPTPVPSSPPDFLSQLTAPKQADARGRQLRNSEFIGSPPRVGERFARDSRYRSPISAILNGRFRPRQRRGSWAGVLLTEKGRSQQPPICRRCRTKHLETGEIEPLRVAILSMLRATSASCAAEADQEIAVVDLHLDAE